jgi:hypothetical protein
VGRTLPTRCPRIPWLGVLAGASCLLALLWPGDVTWICDEPLLLHLAQSWNQQHCLAPVGLIGSRGMPYGPLPIWLYQAALSMTHDLILIAWLKTLISVGLTVLGIWMAARRWCVSRPTAVLIVATTPFLFVYQRVLWDNVFLIPFSALLAWAASAFLERPSSRRAIGLTGAGILLAYVHPVALPALVATAAVALLFEYRWFLRNRGATVACIAALLIAGVHLVVAIWRAPHAEAAALPRSIWSGLTAPFLAGRYFSHATLVTFLGGNWQQALPPPAYIPVLLLQGVSALAVPVTLLGGWLATLVLWRRARRPGPFRLHHKLLLLALATAVAFGLLGVLLQLPSPPHYLNAVWPAYLFLLLYGSRCLCRRGRGRVLFTAYNLANLTLIAVFILFIHVHRGNRTPLYGPVLAVQVAAVKELNTYAKDSQLEVRPANYRTFPHAFQTLLDLYTTPTAPPGAPRRKLVLDYATPTGYSAPLVLRDEGPFP